MSSTSTSSQPYNGYGLGGGEPGRCGQGPLDFGWHRLAAVSILGLAFLIGPAARRLAGEHQPLTATERRQMTTRGLVGTRNSHCLSQRRRTIAELAMACRYREAGQVGR
ncbi:hypothetical protein [Sphaerisporangium corydalis]|uniref:Uncharacterized protein n=1 Tax=Sphaerisporangium corydalis TaxID=1441875 RepID=A0ABV9ET04_9ACTN|nr:hypothetical protein [Sphaerisporangium corydalis]